MTLWGEFWEKQNTKKIHLVIKTLNVMNRLNRILDTTIKKIG